VKLLKELEFPEAFNIDQYVGISSKSSVKKRLGG